MPRYDFRCDDCNLTTEIKRTFHTNIDAPLCPSCDKPTTRVYNATPAIFKGEGWAGKKS